MGISEGIIASGFLFFKGFSQRSGQAKHSVQARVFQHVPDILAHVGQLHAAIVRGHLLEGGQQDAQARGGDVVALGKVQNYHNQQPMSILSLLRLSDHFIKEVVSIDMVVNKCKNDFEDTSCWLSDACDNVIISYYDCSGNYHNYG